MDQRKPGENTNTIQPMKHFSSFHNICASNIGKATHICMCGISQFKVIVFPRETEEM